MRLGKDKLLKIIAVTFLIIWFCAFFLQEINLINSDIGRYIKSGESIFNGNFRLLKENFYSFSYPHYPFVNHHWGVSVIFYPLWKIGGFTLLHIFALFLMVATFLFVFKVASDNSNFKIAFLSSIVLIPIIAYRKEIRPELFSYFFSAVFFFILWEYKNKSISRKWLFLLPLLEFFWVNIHIYFFLGIFIISAFLLEKIIISLKQKKWLAGKLLAIFSLSCFATLLNPSGIKGALYPFFIAYNNRGYRVFEEQSFLFLKKLSIKDPSFAFFEFIFFIIVLSFVVAFFKNKKKISLSNLLLASGVSFMALYAVRNFTLFGFLSLPVFANNLKIVTSNKKQNYRSKFKYNLWFFWLSFFSLFVIFVFYFPALPFNNNIFGIGLIPNINRSAVFFKQENIRGPVFNNYDIGGYLIYHLFPQERVFVDNRPEAYPNNFFQSIYIPMQEKEEIWRKKEKKYGFNAIFFARSDITPWGQEFLINRVKDDNWIPVFVDDFAIIFLKNNKLNKKIIDRYKIPKYYFKFD